MKPDRDANGIVRTWMENGVTQLPDRVLDDVLLEIRAIPQRRRSWGGATLPQLSRAAQVGLATAAVLLAVAMGLAVFLSGRGVGSHIGGPTPTPTPTPMALPQDPIRLEAGTYAIGDPFPMRVTFEVPEGWTAAPYGPLEAGVSRGNEGGVAVVIVDNVVSDPCDASQGLLVPAVGPSVEDLVVAISNWAGFEATEPVDVTLDGFQGKQFELTAPGRSFCHSEISTWSTVERTNGMSANEVNLLRILDVAGTRVLVAAAHQPGKTTAGQVAEIRRVFDSVQFAP
jgi:hypothetical protein